MMYLYDDEEGRAVVLTTATDATLQDLLFDKRRLDWLLSDNGRAFFYWQCTDGNTVGRAEIDKAMKEKET